MNLVVVLRAVRDPNSFVVNRKAQKVFVNREAFIPNPADLNALEAALRLRAAGDTVMAVGYGGAPAEAVLYQARAMGAARAVWVKSDALGTADGFVVARVVERVIDHLGGADVVALGASVLDAGLAQVGPRLAAALGWTLLPDVWALKAAGSAVRAVVRGLGGYRRLEADLPVVATVVRDANQPRYPAAGDIMRVYGERLEVVRPEALGLDAEALRPRAVVRGEAFPGERTFGRRVTVEEGARELAAWMKASAGR